MFEVYGSTTVYIQPLRFGLCFPSSEPRSFPPWILDYVCRGRGGGGWSVMAEGCKVRYICLIEKRWV